MDFLRIIGRELPICTLDGRANAPYLSFTGKELATNANRTRQEETRYERYQPCYRRNLACVRYRER